MTDSADIPFLADVIEAQQYDELVVDHVFEAVTNERILLVNQRQLHNWVAIVDRLEGCVVTRTARQFKGGGRSALDVPPPLAQARPRSEKQRSQGVPVLRQARACARRATQRDTAH